VSVQVVNRSTYRMESGWSPRRWSPGSSDSIRRSLRRRPTAVRTGPDHSAQQLAGCMAQHRDFIARPDVDQIRNRIMASGMGPCQGRSRKSSVFRQRHPAAGRPKRVRPRPDPDQPIEEGREARASRRPRGARLWRCRSQVGRRSGVVRFFPPDADRVGSDRASRGTA
jgi:hypothetical protein